MTFDIYKLTTWENLISKYSYINIWLLKLEKKNQILNYQKYILLSVSYRDEIY